MGTVRLNEVITKMNLENLTPQIDVSKIKIRQPDINRPAVQMTGYFEHFAAGRIQIIGLVEYSYMQQMSVEEKDRIYKKFLSLDIPCVVFCRELEPDELFMKYALENGVALLMTRNATSNFMGEIMEADVERLAQVPEITQAAAEEIYRYFHDQPSDADEQYTQHSPADAGEE